MNVILFGGYARSLLNFRGPLIQALLRRGHAVTAIAPEDDAAVARTLESWGAAYRPVALRRNRLDPTGDLGSLLRLRGLFRELRPDLVLSYTMKPVVYGSLAAASLGFPSASLITGLGNTFDAAGGLRRRTVRFVLERLLSLALHRNKVVFFQNRDDLGLFVDEGLVEPSRAVLVDGTGVELEQFAFTEVPSEQPVFLMLSRLIRQKGVAEFAEAAARVRAQHPEARFWLLGEYESGPDAISTEQIAQWVQRGAIEYLGATTDVRPYLEKSTCVVLPSYYREGIPRSLQEGLATGRPIVTTDTTGCREVVRDGVNGYLVPTRNVDALATALRSLVQEPQTAAAFGRESRRLAEERFDVRIINERIIRSLGC